MSCDKRNVRPFTICTLTDVQHTLNIVFQSCFNLQSRGKVSRYQEILAQKGDLGTYLNMVSIQFNSVYSHFS